MRIGNTLDFTAQEDGHLLLRINDEDDGLFDNNGTVTVALVVE